MQRYITRCATTVSVLACLVTSTISHAGVVGEVNGQIDLAAIPFFETGPIWSEEAQAEVWVPLETQHQYTPVGKSKVDTSFNGGGYFSAGGDYRFNYEYLRAGPGESWFTFNTFAQSANHGDGGGGYSSLDIQITFNHPVTFRLESDVVGAPADYEVVFNGVKGDAAYGPFGDYYGSFPVEYIQVEPDYAFPTGFGTYVHQGSLPAGTYDLSIFARSYLHRYGIGLETEASAQLHIRLLGDANLDGVVGIEDLHAVLNHWDEQVPEGVSYFGDLDGDGLVGITDLSAVLQGWGHDARTVGTGAVPEPMTAGVLLVLAPVLLCRRLAGRTF